MDANKDRMVSLGEFLKSTEKDNNNAKEWEVKDLEVNGFWSQKELEQFHKINKQQVKIEFKWR